MTTEDLSQLIEDQLGVSRSFAYTVLALGALVGMLAGAAMMGQYYSYYVKQEDAIQQQLEAPTKPLKKSPYRTSDPIYES